MTDKVDVVDIESPCVRNCCLDNKDVCLGCFRHISEITGWGSASTERKKQVLSLATERKKHYKHLIPFEPLMNRR